MSTKEEKAAYQAFLGRLKQIGREIAESLGVSEVGFELAWEKGRNFQARGLERDPLLSAWNKTGRGSLNAQRARAVLELRLLFISIDPQLDRILPYRHPAWKRVPEILNHKRFLEVLAGANPGAR